MQNQEIKVWDLFIRVFHWTLVIAFFTAYLTEDDFMTVHVYTGYLILGLVLLRLLWGFAGGRYARFSNFMYAPSRILAYLKDVAGFHAKRYLGHNPAGGAMIMALLVSLVLTLVSGLLTYAAMEFSGPLAWLTSGVGDDMAHAFKEIHEFFANFTLGLVALHVVGVLLASFQHRENLVRSMITGNKKSQHIGDTEVKS